MNQRKLTAAVALLLAVTCSAASAQHRHYHGRSGVVVRATIGVPWYAPYYYPPYSPYYYPPYPVYGAIVTSPPQTITYVAQEPAVTVQAEPAPAAKPEAGYWYYCKNPDGYYPYVQTCPGGWQKVEPTPPATPEGQKR